MTYLSSTVSALHTESELLQNISRSAENLSKLTYPKFIVSYFHCHPKSGEYIL
ncbi:MAG: hypothetical protein DF168_01742 [Candidatus Moanabacter tarae]|uniref:Uncharacterized protein n=1 Tax=Candidatus Moanibacter tarae TaxID=2200854 RepID=A0A2Z4AH85_9BACT|nr:MAG: hypothetical protein DF168_01742 [Candidatus Moanabacter tarae]